MEKIHKEIKNLTVDLEEMMETAGAVQGEIFTDLVCFVMNHRNLIQLIAGAVDYSLEQNKNILRSADDPIAETIVNMLSANTNAYARALDLSDEKIDEALKFMDAMSEKIYNTKLKMRESK